MEVPNSRNGQRRFGPVTKGGRMSAFGSDWRARSTLRVRRTSRFSRCRRSRRSEVPSESSRAPARRPRPTQTPPPARRVLVATKRLPASNQNRRKWLTARPAPTPSAEPKWASTMTPVRSKASTPTHRVDPRARYSGSRPRPSELSDTSSTTARRRRLPRVLGKPHLSARLIPSLWRTTVTSGGKGRLGPSRLARFGTRTSSGMGSQSITRVDLVSRRRTSLQPSTPRAVRCARSRETLGKTRVAGWAPWKCQILETVSAALVLSRKGDECPRLAVTGALGRPSVCVAPRGFHDADAQGDRRCQVSHRARPHVAPVLPRHRPRPVVFSSRPKDCPHPTKTAENGSPPDPHRPHPQSQSGLRR